MRGVLTVNRLLLASSATLLLLDWACKESTLNHWNSPPTFSAFGLEGKTIVHLQIDGQYLYACAGRSGFWRRKVNGGGTWNFLGFVDTVTENSDAPGVVDCDVHGNDLLLVYSDQDASRYDRSIVGIWRSLDGGSTFRRTDSGIVNESWEPSHNIVAIERSRLNPSWGIAVYGNLYRTTDGGTHWTVPGGVVRLPGQFQEIWWHPYKSLDVWYSGAFSSFEPFILHSTDGGITMFSPQSLPYELETYAMFTHMSFDATDSSLLYATSPYLVRSIDGGKSWHFPLGWRSPMFGPITADPRNHRVLYLTSPPWVFESTDGGESMRVIGRITEEIIYSITVSGESQDLYLGTSNGVINYQWRRYDKAFRSP